MTALAQMKGGVEVHVDDLAEIVGAHLRHGDALDDARVVDQNVDDADLVLHVCHQGLHRAFISHVADVAMGPDALFCIGGQPLVHQLLTDVVKDDGRARGGKCLRNGEPDAVGAARDPGDFVLQGKCVHIHENRPPWSSLAKSGTVGSVLENAALLRALHG